MLRAFHGSINLASYKCAMVPEYKRGVSLDVSMRLVCWERKQLFFSTECLIIDREGGW